MTLINGPTIADAISDPANAISQLAKNEKDDAKLVQEIFFRFLCRPPTSEELAAGVKALSFTDEDRSQAVVELAAYESQLDGKQQAWEASQGPPAWVELAPTEMTSTNGAKLTAEPDHAILVEGPNARGTYTVKAVTELTGVTGIRLEALTDPKLPNSGPGRAPNGNFVLSEFQVTAISVADPTKTAPVMLANPTADFSQANYPIAQAIDGSLGRGWAILPQTRKNHVATFEAKHDPTHPGGTLLVFTFNQQFDDQHTLGKFRLSLTTSRLPLQTNTPPALAAIFATPKEQRTPAQRTELANYYRSQDAEYLRLKEAVAVAERLGDRRLVGAQDLAWALINSPAFLFNR
jgi:hypothetical protein